MTHELLALVNDEELTLNRCLLPEKFHKPLRIANALRAVVELHKPDDKSYSGEIGCIGCGFNSEYGTLEQDYPCPTIQAIEEEIK
ncbi:hypothetical protein UFOVP1261_20 [uncultured Caudovirales phage]|nr:hypothetical protein UFOVP1261_20 [uncultured Caudovirales phage]